MPLLNQLMVPMSEGTRIKEGTGPLELPVPTHFRLQLLLILPHKLLSVLLIGKLLPRSLDRGHLLIILQNIFLLSTMKPGRLCLMNFVGLKADKIRLFLYTPSFLEFFVRGART